MQKQWLCLWAVVLLTVSPSCTKKQEAKRRVTPPVAATIQPDVTTSDAPAVVIEEEKATEAVVDETAEAPKKVVRRKPRRIAQNLTATPAQTQTDPVFIIDEPSSTSQTESEIVEPQVVGGMPVEMVEEFRLVPQDTFRAIFGTAVDLQQSGTQEAQLGVGLEFPLGNTARVGIEQNLRKLFTPGVNVGGQRDILAADTRLYVEARLAKTSPAAEVTVNVGATLPVSRRSIRSNNVSRVNAGITAVGAWFGGDLILSATSDAQISFNDPEYNTSGRPVPRFAFGQGVSLDWAVASRLNWVTWGRGYVRSYEADNASLGRFAGPSTTYGLGTYLEYDFGGVRLRGGLLRATSMFEDVRTTDIYFDAEPTTRFFMALTASF